MSTTPHELVGPPWRPSCSCGEWTAALGESIWRSFDRHLLASASLLNPNVHLDDHPDMADKQQIDVANEPVDLTQDDSFMDTGVLHEERICVECGNDLACEGYRCCSQCLEDLGHDGH